MDKDKFKNINTTVETEREALQELKQLIANHISKLQITRRVCIPDVLQQTKNMISLWPQFQNEEDKVVEVWALFWCYRPDGELQWRVKIVWDSDSEGLPVDQLPHYGYEIYLDGNRVGSPGHVYISRSDEKPSFSRDKKPMHEVQKGIYCGQMDVGQGNPPVRLDYAMRLWGVGTDREYLYELKRSRQEYDDMVFDPPSAWGQFDRPSFGRKA